MDVISNWNILIQNNVYRRRRFFVGRVCQEFRKVHIQFNIFVWINADKGREGV